MGFKCHCSFLETTALLVYCAFVFHSVLGQGSDIEKKAGSPCYLQYENGTMDITQPQVRQFLVFALMIKRRSSFSSYIRNRILIMLSRFQF